MLWEFEILRIQCSGNLIFQKFKALENLRIQCSENSKFLEFKVPRIGFSLRIQKFSKIWEFNTLRMFEIQSFENSILWELKVGENLKDQCFKNSKF